MTKRNPTQTTEPTTATPTVQPETLLDPALPLVVEGLTEAEFSLLLDHLSGYPHVRLTQAVAKAPKAKALASCLCGCGALSARTFAPGHDMRLKGVIVVNTKAGKPAYESLTDEQRVYAEANWAGYVADAEARAAAKALAKSQPKTTTPATPAQP